MKGALVVCAQVPLPGYVRSSFSTHLSQAESAALYSRFLADICDTTQDVEGVDFFLAYKPEGMEEHFAGLLPPSFTFLPQEESGRGRCLRNVFHTLNGQGYDRVLVLSSESPDLPICLINQAAEILDAGRAEMVYGPSERDGLYLLGLTRWHPELFDKIDWEKPQLGSRALREARKLGMRVRVLPQWYDLETVEDLRRHLNYYTIRRKACSDPEIQCRTGEYLFEIQERILSEVCRTV